MTDINTYKVADAGLAGRVSAFFSEFGARMVKRRVYRETYNELSALSSRELADLGIARSDIANIAREAAYGKL